MARLGFIVDLFQQTFVQWIVGGFTQTGDAQLVDIATDTTAQFWPWQPR